MLQWLVQNEFIERKATARTATAVYCILGAKPGGLVSAPDATGYAIGNNGKGPRLNEKGQEKGQDGAKANTLHRKGLRSVPQQQRAKMRATSTAVDVVDVDKTDTHARTRETNGELQHVSHEIDRQLAKLTAKHVNT
ncbi:MAG: hypothetical protein OXI46_01470 [Gemmatimonadota bacterium]|nr:hypothetical protein [Gemmatimonadota bacterium]